MKLPSHLGDPNRICCYISPSTGHRIIEKVYGTLIVRVDLTTNTTDFVPKFA